MKKQFVTQRTAGATPQESRLCKSSAESAPQSRGYSLIPNISWLRPRRPLVDINSAPMMKMNSPAMNRAFSAGGFFGCHEILARCPRLEVTMLRLWRAKEVQRVAPTTRYITAREFALLPKE